eukprot:CAMPEP_0197460704 /NCGR_PEP_ID=MMETSP1175-20131217/54753_1 /TAXON_ID=1003142 /ORGANISM="Triceratium dubium, Strain CCMP147" /LENGTH=106 /DNA_ID=CAMNT_0042995851 /DNA_START=114 /DNA_END=431 /DNA_ORIENTATION=+
MEHKEEALLDASDAPSLPPAGSQAAHHRADHHDAPDPNDPTHSAICRNAFQLLEQANTPDNTTEKRTHLGVEAASLQLRRVHKTESGYREGWTDSVDDLMGQVRAR